MKTLTRAAEMQAAAAGVRGLGKRLGFVPTMGALHQGHLSLVRRARAECDVTAVSIFVNPAQFGPQEDYLKYPRDLARDSALLEREGADWLFAPSVEEMYPGGFETYVTLERTGAPLEGEFRPGHFRGVATVVLKLFNIVQPSVAYFGQKDAQQSVVVQQMARDLNLPVEIVVCPIVRERDGLAMSSRNAYLHPEDRQSALALHRSLVLARELIEAGERSTEAVVRAIQSHLARVAGARVDYVAAVDANTLIPMPYISGRILFALAVWIGATRLIDNMVVEASDGPPVFRL
jgi:pantoate--beta-alanine ligase